MNTVTIILCILGVSTFLLIKIVTICGFFFKQKVKNEAKELFNKSAKISPGVLTEEDIKGLPEPVQRHLKYAQIIGKEKISNVRLKQKGFLRQKEGQKWMPLEAEQYYTIDPPAFIWAGKIKAAPLFSITARDMYSEGKGYMLIKLLSTFTVADTKGKEMDQATLMRYLNEIMWFPTAYVNDYIQWEPVDTHSAKATISNNGLTASAVLHFNEKGEMTNFIGERYNNIDNKMTTWSTPIKEYKEIRGIRIPAKSEAVWKLESGDFCYIKVEIVDIEYNISSIY